MWQHTGIGGAADEAVLNYVHEILFLKITPFLPFHAALSVFWSNTSFAGSWHIFVVQNSQSFLWQCRRGLFPGELKQLAG